MSDPLTLSIWYSHGRPAMAELFSTAIYSFIVLLSSSPSSPSSSAILDGLSLGLSMIFVIQISGAHLNPAISLSYLILGKMSLVSWISYSISQLFGSFLGTVFGCWLINSDRYEDTFIGNGLSSADHNPLMDRFKNLCLEMILTTVLIVSHLVSSLSLSNHQSLQKANLHIPFIVAATRIMISWCGLPYLGHFGSPSLVVGEGLMRGIMISSLSSPLAFVYLMFIGSILSSITASLIHFCLQQPSSPPQHISQFPFEKEEK